MEEKQEYKLLEYGFTVSFLGTIRGMGYDRLGARRDWFEKGKFIFINDFERYETGKYAIKYFSEREFEVTAEIFKAPNVLCLFENGTIHEPYVPTEEDMMAQDWHTCELYPGSGETFFSQKHWK